MTEFAPQHWDPIRAYTSHALVTGKRTPGLVEIDSNSSSPRKWDEMAGYGLSGSTLRFTGLGLPKFDMVVSLYTREHIAEWAAFAPLLDPPKRGYPRALDIWHPKLVGAKIKSCVVLDISLPKTSEEGVTQYIVYWQAFRAVKFQLSKVEASKAQPLDPYDQINYDKLQQVNELAKG